MNYLKLGYLIIILLVLKLPLAYGDCNLGNGAVSLGTNSSFTVYNGPLSAKGYTGFSCSGLSINITLLGFTKVNANILSTTNNMLLKNVDGSGDSIPYLIYPDDQYSMPFRAGQEIDYKSLGLLNIFIGVGNIDIPLYIKTSPGANVRAGTYMDTINVQWDYFICRSGLLVCLSWWSGSGQIIPITVTTVVDKDCIINNAPDINFGAKALVGQFDPVTQSINLTCTNTEGYKVWFTDGDNKQGSWRRMADGAGNYLQYQIYQADNATIWDNLQKLTGIGIGTNQAIIYKARINPNQPEVPAGNYTDNVSVVVEY